MSEVIERDEQSTELVTLPSYENALQVFTTEEALDALYAQVETKVSGVAYDMSTKKGRDQCASDAYKVARSKMAVEKLGAKLSAEYKEIPKKIDASRRRIKERFDALQEQVRQPLNDWEAAEQERVANHKHELVMLEGFSNCGDLDAAMIRANVEHIESLTIDESWEEFEAEAHRVKSKTLEVMRTALAAREKYEAEQAELARLRAEAEARAKRDEEERIAREAAERATREAEAKAQAEREEAARREAEAKAAAERAEQERLEAIERQKQAEARAEAEKLAAEQRAKEAAEAARLAEIERQRREQEQAEAEQRRREADQKHRLKLMGEAKQAIMEIGLSEETARSVVLTIARGEVPHITFNF